MLSRTMLAAAALAITALTVPAAVPDAEAVPVMRADVLYLSNLDKGRVVEAAVGETVSVHLRPATVAGGLTARYDHILSSDPATEGHYRRRVQGF
ncbi:hypothetical protein AB0N16_31180 [Streptomyces sp. NPDC051105]|uniref:hypothetical protein n=1 Tax=Streptomyces sp. NPDC051105 TaxID=3154843 RepID=UPI003427D2D5